jgi:hypothetical protein
LYFPGASDKILCDCLQDMMFRVHITSRLLNHESKIQFIRAMEEIVMLPRRYLVLICLIAALPPLVFAESDIPGWGKAKWGMSHSEVKKLYELNNWEAGDTPISKLKKKIKIMGHDFAVALYFDERSANGKLYKVVLAHFDSTKKDPAWLNSIKNILVEKYGNPAFFEVKDNMKISRWTKNAGLLKLTSLTGKTVMCAIEYMSVGAESKKL